MLRTLCGSLAVCLLVFFANSGFCAGPDLYWISIGVESNSAPVHVMQIDSDGNVTIPPVAMASWAETGGHNDRLTAIANGPGGKLYLWILSEVELQQPPPKAPEGGGFDPWHPIYRVNIDKDTVTRLGIVQTRYFACAPSQTFQVASEASPKFLTYMAQCGSVRGVKLTAAGDPTGRGNRLIPSNDGEDQGGVCADGSMAYSRTSDICQQQGCLDTIWLQRLKKSRVATGAPKKVIEDFELEDMDLTNLMPGNQRFLIYYADEDGQIWLQVINDTTLALMGQRKLVATTATHFRDSMMSIDSDGRFLVYIDDSPTCKATALFYQALDATGAASGDRKLLADSCDFIPFGALIEGIDLLDD